MEKIRGAITVELFIEEATYLNKLIDRDTPKPVRHAGKDFFDEDKYDCPVCGNFVHEELFCRHCGQRLDTTNVEL